MSKRIINCLRCQRDQEHYAKGLCARCYRRVWYELHREEEIARARRWQKANPDRVRMLDEQRRKRDRDKRCAYFRAYRRKNPAKKKAQDRRYRIENREKLRDYHRRYYAEHRELFKIDGQRRYKENPEKYRLHRMRRKARERQVPNTMTLEDLEQIGIIGRCFYCGKKANLTLDHFVPISKGGGTTRANIVLACRTCNCSKHTQLPEEILGQLSLLKGESNAQIRSSN